MKKLLLLSLCLAGQAFAGCRDVYNPMTGQWEYRCSADPSAPQAPVCQNQYDPMNGVWVLVCH